MNKLFIYWLVEISISWTVMPHCVVHTLCPDHEGSKVLTLLNIYHQKKWPVIPEDSAFPNLFDGSVTTA